MTGPPPRRTVWFHANCLGIGEVRWSSPTFDRDGNRCPFCGHRVAVTFEERNRLEITRRRPPTTI